MNRLLTTLSLMLAVLIGSTGVSYALPPCPGSPTNSGSTTLSWTNCVGTFNKVKGRYVGEWKNGKAHGQGTVTFASGTKYVGEFKNQPSSCC